MKFAQLITSLILKYLYCVAMFYVINRLIDIIHNRKRMKEDVKEKNFTSECSLCSKPLVVNIFCFKQVVLDYFIPFNCRRIQQAPTAETNAAQQGRRARAGPKSPRAGAGPQSPRVALVSIPAHHFCRDCYTCIWNTQKNEKGGMKCPVCTEEMKPGYPPPGIQNLRVKLVFWFFNISAMMMCIFYDDLETLFEK